MAITAFISLSPVLFARPRITSRTCNHRTVMTAAQPSATSSAAPAPVLVCDVLDTLVEDPFTHGMHAYFGYESLRDFIGAKRPNLWVQFETGEIDEQQLANDFFLDGTPVDLTAFKRYLTQTYRLIPGVESMLKCLVENQVPVHLCSNYPQWYTLIEQTVQLENLGAKWSFVSSMQGVRKPDPRAYHLTAQIAGVPPEACVLLDDREANCTGARDAGYRGAVKFVDVEQARRDLAPFFGACLLEPSETKSL